MKLDGFGRTLVAVTWTFQAAAFIAVGLRIFVRLRLTKPAGRDDWTMVVALFLATLFTSMITASACTGTGRHLEHLLREHPDELPHALLINVITQAVAVHSFTVSKLSIAFLLVRIFKPSHCVRAVFYFLIGSLMVLCTIVTFVTFFQCNPASALWTPEQWEYSCWSPAIYANFGYCVGCEHLEIYTKYDTSLLTNVALAASIDILFALYPAFICSRLKLTLRRKIGLGCLFGVGLVAAGVTIYKTTIVAGLGDIADVTYSTAKIFIATSVESNIVIIAGSIPTLNPILRYLRGKECSSTPPYSARESPKRDPRLQVSSLGQTAVESELSSIDAMDVEFVGSSSAESSTRDFSSPEPPMDGISKSIELEIHVEPGPAHREGSELDEAIPRFLAVERLSGDETKI